MSYLDYMALWSTGESAQKNERGHYHFFRVVTEQYPLKLYEEPKLAYQHST
jgi:hypothetical protein